MFRCPICGKGFAGQGALSHLKSHFQSTHVPLSKCPVCGQSHPQTQHFFANLEKRQDHLAYTYLYALPSYGKTRNSSMEKRKAKRLRLYTIAETVFNK